MAKQGQPIGYTIGEEARREIGDVVSWHQRHNDGGGNLPTEPFTKFGPRTIRIVKCTTNSKCSTYPTRPATKFPIKFGELNWDDTTCGNETATFEAYDPSEDRIAMDFTGAYHEEDQITQVFLSHDKWYFFSGQEELIAEAIATSDSCPADEGGSGSGSEGQEVSVEDFRIQPSCTLVDPPPTVTNPKNHRWPAGSLLTMIKRKCAGGEEEWRVVDVELRKACFYVMIEDTTECMRYAGLKTAQEWCPSDEPPSACLLVDYTDCGSGSGACDLAWDFAPLFACCNGNSGSG